MCPKKKKKDEPPSDEELLNMLKYIEAGLRVFSPQPEPYGLRCVGRYEENDIFISTARVRDAQLPFETAVAHPDYNDGKIIIVETYGTSELAKQGHEKWVKIMTSEQLPDSLTCVGTAEIAMILDEFDEPNWRVYPRRRKGMTH